MPKGATGDHDVDPGIVVPRGSPVRVSRHAKCAAPGPCPLGTNSNDLVAHSVLPIRIVVQGDEFSPLAGLVPLVEPAARVLVDQEFLKLRKSQEVEP